MQLISGYRKEDYSSRLMTALVKYFEDKLINNYSIDREEYKKTTGSITRYSHLASILFLEAAELELTKYTNPFTISTLRGKDKKVTQRDLEEFIKIMSYGSFVIKVEEKQRKEKTKAELIRLYVILLSHLDLLDNVYILAASRKANYSRKVNHIKQILNNNKHTWDYTQVEEGLPILTLLEREGVSKYVLPLYIYSKYIDKSKQLVTKVIKPALYQVQLVDINNNKVLHTINLPDNSFYHHSKCKNPKVTITVKKC